MINPFVAQADDDQTYALGYPVYVNGQPVTLNNSLIKDGRTYVQLRELCSAMNVGVDWSDPRYHMAPIPGGNMPAGINLTNPTFVYTADVTNYYNTAEKIKCMEITGIYQKYSTYNSDGSTLKYAFSGEGLVVRANGAETVIPLTYNPSNGRQYLAVPEFKEKVQPYLTDICMQ